MNSSIDVAYEEALRRINNCIERKDLSLDLSNLGLVTIPSELRKLVQLHSLSLNNNQLNDISLLNSLTQIRGLFLHSNLINDLSPLNCLTQLRELSLYDNQINDLNPLRSLTRLQTLLLQNNQIYDLIPLSSLTRLLRLILNNNLISDLTPLRPLTRLLRLSLYTNQISDLSPLDSLIQLIRLYLQDNQLSDLSPLKSLTQLQELFLSDNQLSDLRPLVPLTRLQTLSLGNNQLNDLSPISSLVQLQELSLYDNQINDLRPLASLTQLQRLFLHSNQIENLRPLSYLIWLQILSLAHNQISDLSPLAFLTHLQKLNLGENQISDLNSLISLKQLQELNLHTNKIGVFPNFLLQLKLPIKDIDFLSPGISIGNNPWKYPPFEILLKGSESIQAYFNSLENKSPKPLNEVKILIVGEGAAGKTSLVRRLLGQDFNPQESQTHGILIERSEFVCNDDQVQVHFWDFGGQEIMHATHQFFLTERSIYILVLDSRKEDQTEYWLKHIDAFGKQSPVLVVINKVDENPGFDLNRPFLNEKYPSIANRFFRVSCKRGDGIPEFQDYLRSVIQDMDIRKQPFSPDWLAVKQTLSTMQRDYITYDEFQQYCEADNVADEAQQKTLLSFLNDLGIIFEHKRQSDRFGTFIMNPQWLTQAVYRIINAPEVTNNNGFLAWSDLASILHKSKETTSDPNQPSKELKASYPSSKFAFIIGMLQQFELCYEVEKDRWMIPDLLPVSRKVIPIDFIGAAEYLFIYDFLPNSVLPTLMVQLSRWIVPDLQWRTGVVLKDLSSESYAYIEADKEAKTIAIRVKSQGANFQRSFLNLIRQTLQDINKKLNISIEEKVALPDVPNQYVTYQNLINLQEMGETQILIPGLKRRFVISDLLEGVDAISRTGNSDRAQKTNIFISYSHKDPSYKEELITALYPLIRQDKIQLWQDGEIVAGQRWNDEIMGHLEKAHVVIALMSPDFLQSEFCYSIELANASKAEARGEKTIIPIQIRPCAWQDLPIGAIQGIPAKPISDYPNHDNGWMDVYKEVKRALDLWQSRFNQARSF